MSYTIQQLATLAGVTTRTLHHYDEIGLLKPTRQKTNGYRQYEEKELLRLQQILFFRELDFSLPEIIKILNSPSFDMKKALEDQRNLIELKKKRLGKLITTIDKTINKLTNKKNMTDKQLYSDFNTDEQDQYAEEAKQKWGHTDAYKQSRERVAKMSKEDMANLKKAGEDLAKKIAEVMPKGAESKEAQELIALHYNGLRTFYEPSVEIYRGLAEMYVADPRFTAYYERFGNGLAQFMHDAMLHYIKTSLK